MTMSCNQSAANEQALLALYKALNDALEYDLPGVEIISKAIQRLTTLQ